MDNTPIGGLKKERALKLISAVCFQYDLSMEELLGPRRFKTLSKARSAVYVHLHLAGLTTGEIAYMMNKDRATIVYHLTKEGV